MTLGSLFDGAGGFPLAGEMAGFTPLWASEIEPFPIRVTTKRYDSGGDCRRINRKQGDKMTSTEIAEIARTRKPLPEGQILAARQLYYVLCAIYRVYGDKQITLDEAKRQKSDAIKQYESEELSYRIHTETMRRNDEILKLFSTTPKENHCPICKRAFEIFTGMIRTANDKLLTEWEQKKRQGKE